MPVTSWTWRCREHLERRLGNDGAVIDRLLFVVAAQERRFPKGLDPFKMIARLAEECGELAGEVQHWEDEGLKRSKLGDPDAAKTAKEVMDVLTAALTIAKYYGLLEAVQARIELSIERAVEDGLLTANEVSR